MTTPPELDRLARVLVDRAAADVAALGVLVPDPRQANEILGFLAQQAVEKSLKAALAAGGIEPPRTHDLSHIHDLARAVGLVPPIDIDAAEALYPYAVEFRYNHAVGPGRLEPAEMLRLAGAATEWARAMLATAG